MTRDVKEVNLKKFGDFRIRGRVRWGLIVFPLFPHLFIIPKLPTTTLISLQHLSCTSLNHFTGSNCLFAAFWACSAISFIKIKGNNTYYKEKYNIFHTISISSPSLNLTDVSRLRIWCIKHYTIGPNRTRSIPDRVLN